MRKLIKAQITFDGERFTILTALHGIRIFKGNAEKFRLFLIKNNVADSTTLPRSIRNISYKQMVDEIINGINKEVWIWDYILKKIPKFIEVISVKENIFNKKINEISASSITDFDPKEKNYKNVTIEKETLQKGQTFTKCKLIKCTNKGATIIDCTWEDGDWKDGIWEFGRWRIGTWHTGIWKDGYWEKGIWHDGTWKSGRWYDGYWNDGTWEGGMWFNGTWKNGTWKRGVWKKGTWEKGTWKDGTWNNGTWKKGIWEDGTWIDGIWKDGTWKKGRRLDRNLNAFVQENILKVTKIAKINEAIELEPGDIIQVLTEADLRKKIAKQTASKISHYHNKEQRAILKQKKTPGTEKKLGALFAWSDTYFQKMQALHKKYFEDQANKKLDKIAKKRNKEKYNNEYVNLMNEANKSYQGIIKKYHPITGNLKK